MLRALLFSLCFAVAGASARAADPVVPLPGTEPLTAKGDLTDQLVAGVDRFLLKQIDQSVGRRERHWHRDLSSRDKYEVSVAPNRQHLAKIIGAVDTRLPSVPETTALAGQSSVLAEAESYEVRTIRWPVFRGVYGEGLVLEPKRQQPLAECIVVPDADQTPELLAGLTEGAAGSDIARRLAESGCRVWVPVIINRDDTWSIGARGTQPSNLPHREFIYRGAFELGRHIIGYEVQKIEALVDWLDGQRTTRHRKLGIFGYGEGGLLALYAGALDPRLDVVGVSGYFGPRNNVWQEPIYRNVFGLLDEFGDAELASLIAPRALVVEASRVPAVDGPPKPRKGRGGGAAPGKLETPALDAVAAELGRAAKLVHGLPDRNAWIIAASAGGNGPPGSDKALTTFLHALDAQAKLAAPGSSASLKRPLPVAADRMHRQFEELNDYTQSLLADSQYVRNNFWADADRKSRDPAKWQQSTRRYRRYFYDDVIGRFELPLMAPKPRTRKVYDEPLWTGYEVVMDVFPDVIAYGILLVPKNIPAGQKRPVVVCQHGLEGRPKDVIEHGPAEHFYHCFAATLAERGFITYAPQNLYIFKDRFRSLQLKSNPLKKTLFSTIVPQHQQTVNWLSTLPMVDGKRIAFYGLSYGGKSAMRIPALVENYCLSICSGDFNEWVEKNASNRMRASYLAKPEYEIFEFDLGSTFNYAEMANLIAPRPFMVERGHRDGVGLDEWVSFEYAKVRLLYTDLRIPGRTTLEYFDGPHTINGIGTFAFLHRHLNWP
ncbi:MAG TPA: dienelactone hydrolase family protein [Pirellulales bacterium]